MPAPTLRALALTVCATVARILWNLPTACKAGDAYAVAEIRTVSRSIATVSSIGREELVGRSVETGANGHEPVTKGAESA